MSLRGRFPLTPALSREWVLSVKVMLLGEGGRVCTHFPGPFWARVVRLRACCRVKGGRVCTHFPGPFWARVVRLRAFCRVKGGRVCTHFPGPFWARVVRLRECCWVKGGRLWGTSPALFGRVVLVRAYFCFGGNIMKEEKRRRIVLINRTFQFKLIIKFILLNVFIMLFFSFILYLFLNSEIESNLKSAHVSYRNLKDMLFPVIITLSVLNILISSIIIWVFILFASHKIAGPLFRFNQILKNMCNRDFRPAPGIRDGDQLYDVSETLHKTLETVSGDFREIKKEVNSLRGECKGHFTDERMQRIDFLLDKYMC